MSARGRTLELPQHGKHTPLNTVADSLGLILCAGLLLGAVPRYIRMLGVEAYGCIGAYLTVVSMLRGLDFGMDYTVSREMAHASALPQEGARIRDLARTYELLFAVVAGGTALVVAVLAWTADNTWLRAETLDAVMVRNCTLSAAISLGLQWLPVSCQSALIGLERQVVTGTVRVVEANLTCFPHGCGAAAKAVAYLPDALWYNAVAVAAAILLTESKMLQLDLRKSPFYRPELSRPVRKLAALSGGALSAVRSVAAKS